MKLCECGCGRAVPIATYTIRAKGIIKGEPVRFVNGHTSRIREARERTAAFEVPNPGGLCMCGCGKPAPIVKTTRMDRGQVEGMSFRFIRGHNGHRHTEECKRRIAEAGIGRKPSPETCRKISESKRGERNPAWRGGKPVRRKRRLIYVGEDHPMAYANGYVFEHRLVMAGVLGRPLRSDEHVHHIDLDSLNNAPENLLIVTSSQHSRIHRLLQWRQLGPLEVLALVGVAA